MKLRRKHYTILQNRRQRWPMAPPPPSTKNFEWHKLSQKILPKLRFGGQNCWHSLKLREMYYTILQNRRHRWPMAPHPLPPIILNDTNYPKKLYSKLDLKVKTVDIRWNWKRCSTQFYRTEGRGGQWRPLPPIILNDTNYTNKSLESELNGEYESSQMSENILISWFYSRFRLFWPN